MADDDLTNEEKEALQYRFVGYQLPKIQLDLTGAANYYFVDDFKNEYDHIHPYYKMQPLYWVKDFDFE